MTFAKKSDRPVPAGRRLENNYNKTSKYGRRFNSKPADEGTRLGELEAARAKLGGLIQTYANLLANTTLAENRTTQEREAQKGLLLSMLPAAGELDEKNVLEGTHSLLAAVINASVLLHDQLNKLKYENFILNQKIEKMADKAKQPEESDVKNEPASS
jgi:hypothetical protein